MVRQAGLELGVEQMTSLPFLRSYLCMAVASLPVGPRDAAFLRVLEDLPRLRRLDAAIVDELRTVHHRMQSSDTPMLPPQHPLLLIPACVRITCNSVEACFAIDHGMPRSQVAFVPTTSGSLMAPSALHDPRNADLVALLDAGSAFPAGAFAADTQVPPERCRLSDVARHP